LLCGFCFGKFSAEGGVFMSTTVYKNANIVLYDRIRKGNLIVKDGKIAEIVDRFDIKDAETVDVKGLYLAPGFVDIHVHGGGGYSAMSGNPEDIKNMCKAHAVRGTTSILPTTLAAPMPKIVAAVEAIKKAAEDYTFSNILGAHLEGPYLSLEMKGAQSPENIINPVDVSPTELLDLWKGIRMVGAAPEIPGGMELGKEISKRGIVASVAHSNATYEIVDKALDYGYSDITHIYSACSSVIKVNLFRVAGVVEAGLSLDGYTTQFIADLRHLPVGLIKLIYKAKGPDRAYAITDGLEFSASDMKEGEIYIQENDLAVVYEDGVMKLADRSSLAGSVATCADLVRNMYKKCDISLVDSVKMASTTPARVVGFGHRKGLIKANYDADLVIFDDDVNIKAVVTNGNIIVNKI